MASWSEIEAAAPELSVVALNATRDRRVIDLWTAAGGLRHIERA